MRWTFKRLVIWFIAFVVTGLGSSLFHSNLCTVLQIIVALFLGLPFICRVAAYMPPLREVDQIEEIERQAADDFNDLARRNNADEERARHLREAECSR